MLITGHNALNYHRNKIDREIDYECRFCQEDDETTWHILTECPVFLRSRRDIFLGKQITDGQWTVPELVEFSELKDLALALEGWEYEHDHWDEW